MRIIVSEESAIQLTENVGQPFVNGLLNAVFCHKRRIMKTQIAILPDYIMVSYPEILSVEELQHLVAYFETEIDEQHQDANRLHDLRATTSNLIDYDNLVPLVRRRRKISAPPKHKDAYVVINDLQFGMVRMWQTMMESSGRKIAIFFSYEEADEYLKEIK
jgi:hypothetical protein